MRQPDVYTVLKWYPPAKYTAKQSVTYYNCRRCEALESVKIIETKEIEPPALEVVVWACSECGANHTPTVFGGGNETSDGLPIIIGIELVENELSLKMKPKKPKPSKPSKPKTSY